MNHVDSRFRRPISVIVPVYNGALLLRRLILSLEHAVPERLEGLEFFFSDDGSPDPEIAKLFLAPFFRRPDVQVFRRAENKGFIFTVNEAAERVPPESDILLLNADTEIWDEVFSLLQTDAYALPHCASVTPLTNNCTIASLFNFPAGDKLPTPVTPELISQVVKSVGFPTPLIPAPTGVGFCLYLRRDAIEMLGLFDAIYGRGYCEEVDWCRRAVAKGWVNLISTRAFVYHAGSGSFGSEARLKLIDDNSLILNARYPDYAEAGQKYTVRDPLKSARLAILLELARQWAKPKAIFLMVLHRDPESVEATGTGEHVSYLNSQLRQNGYLGCVVFPEGDFYRFRIRLEGELVLNEAVHKAAFSLLVPFLETQFDCLHVHHTLWWNNEAIESLAGGRFASKLFTAHDFYVLSPSTNLLREYQPPDFCAVEPDLKVCNRCLSQNLKVPNESIELYRAKRFQFLLHFDSILFPSSSLLPYFAKAFGKRWVELKERCFILAHDLSAYFEIAPAAERTQPKSNLIAFIGAVARQKGSLIIGDAVAELEQRGFEVELWGKIHVEDPRLLKLKHFEYQGPKALAKLFSERNPLVAGIPSVWAETFCYTLFESLILSSTAVPVVGPFGNPAEVVRKHNVGVIMEAATPEALVKACEEARSKHDHYRFRINDFVKNSLSQPRDYFSEYETQFKKTFKERGEIDFAQLSVFEQMNSLNIELAQFTNRVETPLMKIYARSGIFLAKYPKLKCLLSQVEKMIWGLAMILKSKVKGSPR